MRLPEHGPALFTSRMSKEYEDMSEAVCVSDFECGMEEEADMRHLCRPGCGPPLELLCLPHSSAERLEVG